MDSNYPFFTFEQRIYPKWERGYIVGEMSEANFYFINKKLISGIVTTEHNVDKNTA